MDNTHSADRPSLAALSLSALGVVYGDIGTSPLYALRECFHSEHSVGLSEANVIGVLSLIVWSLLIVITLKYITLVLRADNKGEGGILALMALASRKVTRTRFDMMIIAVGLFGTALLFGDGVITPAISVLSAMEGLKVATPALEPYVLPLTVAVLTLLFGVQKFGTARIGRIFGPIVMLWFIVLAALGIRGIIINPDVLVAFNPLHGITFLIANQWTGFLVLGGVFLVVTGGESMYADMGHFGKKPIRIAWLAVALPALLLNYFGQGALMIGHPEATENPFFYLVPEWGIYPMVALATMATVIASQALISGIFSLTRQAILMGYSPRLKIVHTSEKEIGQIYLPQVNWTLFILVIWTVLNFKSSSALAAAYGMTVSSAIVVTTFLMAIVAYRLWKWNLAVVIAMSIFFAIIDLSFWGANVIKIHKGGWFPLVIGIFVFVLMTTWKRGKQILYERLRSRSLPLKEFIESLDLTKIARISGTSIFMGGDRRTTPPSLLQNLRHNKVLHKKVLMLTFMTEDVPRVESGLRVEIKDLGCEFYQVVAHYGFVEQPDVQEVIRECIKHGMDLNPQEVTYVLGRETLIATDRPGMAIWRERLFAFMSRNAERPAHFFNIPSNQALEIGMQVEL